MQILGSSELLEDVHKNDLCVDCGACVGLCPYFVSHNGKIARLFPCTMSQGRCHAHCPKTQVDLNELATWLTGKPYDLSALGHVRTLVKAKAGPAMKGKGTFQNGGTVSALTVFALNQGLITGAALTGRDGLTPAPFLARTEAEVLACSGSRYMASPTLSTVMKETTTKSSSRLLVVGTACQMTALTRMRMNPMNRDDFRDPVAFAIGLFCTWALDTRRLKALVENRLDSGDILSMDVPPPPAQAMTFTTSKGRVDIPLAEIRSVIPKGCTICPDMTAELTDLSVGALEGEDGWNTLIIRSEKGERLVADAVAKGFLETGPMPAENLANLEKGALGKKKRALTRARELNLLNLDPEKGRSALVVDRKLVDTLCP